MKKRKTKNRKKKRMVVLTKREVKRIRKKRKERRTRRSQMTLTLDLIQALNPTIRRKRRTKRAKKMIKEERKVPPTRRDRVVTSCTIITTLTMFHHLSVLLLLFRASMFKRSSLMRRIKRNMLQNSQVINSHSWRLQRDSCSKVTLSPDTWLSSIQIQEFSEPLSLRAHS